MDFGFTAEQEQLRSQVRRFLDAECPLTRVRELAAASESHSADLWHSMAELGWLALGIPEAHGGLGLGWEELAVVLEEMGRTLFPSPFLAHSVAARTIAELATEQQKARWLPSLAAGDTVGALAVLEPSDRLDESGVTLAATTEAGHVRLRGEKMFVADGAAASLFVVATREGPGVSLFVVEAGAPGLDVQPLVLVDPTRRAARLRFDKVPVTADSRLGAAGAAWPAVRKALDAATVGLCAEMVGAADGAIQLATEYAKTRRQFGQPIGRFQGIKHALAELYVATESARSLTYYAAWALDRHPDASASVSMAKAMASEALDRAGEEGIQIHGAIGYTWECDAHLYYKRGRYCRNLLGSPAWHHERVLAERAL